MNRDFSDRLRPIVTALVTVTPLRSLRVRQALARSAGRLQRQRRRRLERRGDATLSRPALFGMDVKLAELLGDGGYFVEAGANDGYTQSNTYYLERFHGWRGLLVEPAPQLHREAVAERPAADVVRAALVPPESAGSEITLRFAGLMSLVAGARGSDAADSEWVASAFTRGERDVRSFTAPGRTLTELLDSVGAPEVDLLSLDLEGYEPQALQGLDLERRAPRWLLVEAHDEAARAAIEAVLGDRYVVADERFSQWDVLYRRADVAAAR